MLCLFFAAGPLVTFFTENGMTVEQLIKEKSADIRNIAAQHGVRTIRIFGSVARGDSHPGSDIDFLVDAGPNTSSWFPAGLVLDLEEILGCRVEVVTENGLNPHLREHVLREAVPL
jgi:predicted nucleotidyltransferase